MTPGGWLCTTTGCPTLDHLSDLPRVVYPLHEVDKLVVPELDLDCYIILDGLYFIGGHLIEILKQIWAALLFNLVMAALSPSLATWSPLKASLVSVVTEVTNLMCSISMFLFAEIIS